MCNRCSGRYHRHNGRYNMYNSRYNRFTKHNSRYDCRYNSRHCIIGATIGSIVDTSSGVIVAIVVIYTYNSR